MMAFTKSVTCFLGHPVHSAAAPNKRVESRGLAMSCNLTDSRWQHTEYTDRDLEFMTLAPHRTVMVEVNPT